MRRDIVCVWRDDAMRRDAGWNCWATEMNFIEL